MAEVEEEHATERAAPKREHPVVYYDVHVLPPAGVQTSRVDGSREIFVGASPACDLVLDDRRVSRRHVALDIETSGLRVRDLGSTNGTFVSGVRVKEVVVEGGETLSLGGVQLRVARVEAEAPLAISRHVMFGAVVGASSRMRRLFPTLQRLASADAPVLLEGEPGTGKELVAQALHEGGARSGGPFIVFEPAATSAQRAEDALFESASHAAGGTLVIDEVGDLSSAAQARLRRALQEQTSGAATALLANVRVIATSSRDLERAIEEGRFREDLLLLLAVGRVTLPPLRHRDGDVPLLAEHFWKKLGGAAAAYPKELTDRLRHHSWPGNVRELQTAVARQLATGEHSQRPVLGDAHLSTTTDVFARVLKDGLPFPRARERVLLEFQDVYLEHMLTLHKGSIKAAAAASGVGVRYFQLLRSRRRDP